MVMDLNSGLVHGVEEIGFECTTLAIRYIASPGWATMGTHQEREILAIEKEAYSDHVAPFN